YLNRAEAKGFYEDVSNGVLWPVLHYRIDQMPYHPTGWETFQRVSEAFANAIIEAYQPGDVIWVHDYHLVLVPGLVRTALPDAGLPERMRLMRLVLRSREAIESYSSHRQRIDEQVGRINGRYGATADAPIRLLSRNLSVEDTASLYEAADVMLVTPLRDGMNL